MICDFCRDAEATEKRGPVGDPMNGEKKNLYLCAYCASRWDEQELDDVKEEKSVKEYVGELQKEGLVIVDDFDLAHQIYDASSILIGKRGVFGWTIQRVRIGAAVPAVDAGRTGYKIYTI